MAGFVSLAWDGEHDDAARWNTYAQDGVNEFGKDMMSIGAQDMPSFCPNYSNLNPFGKNMFWISLLAALTKHESGFDPDGFEVVQSDLGNIVKRGLTQIDLDRADVHGCEVLAAGELYDPKTNLECAANIMNYWVAIEGYISRSVQQQGTLSWRGASRVWPSLQGGDTLADIQQITSTSDVCIISN